MLSQALALKKFRGPDVLLNIVCRHALFEPPGDAERCLGTTGDCLDMGMTEVERRMLLNSFSPERLAVRLPEASYISGFSRSEIYRRAGRGEIVLLKCGCRTLVDMQSLRAAVEALPRAGIKDR